MKIGVMFGSPQTTTGGNALKFYASVRLDIRRTGGIKRATTSSATKPKVKVVKNNRSKPPRSTFCLARGHQPHGRDHRHGGGGENFG